MVIHCELHAVVQDIFSKAVHVCRLVQKSDEFRDGVVQDGHAQFVQVIPGGYDVPGISPLYHGQSGCGHRTDTCRNVQVVPHEPE